MHPAQTDSDWRMNTNMFDNLPQIPLSCSKGTLSKTKHPSVELGGSSLGALAELFMAREQLLSMPSKNSQPNHPMDFICSNWPSWIAHALLHHPPVPAGCPSVASWTKHSPNRQPCLDHLFPQPPALLSTPALAGGIVH